MFYLKNDDMEGLFRKAAENYHLDATKASNWDAVYHALSAGKEEKPAEKKKKKRRFFFWWLMLIPAGLLTLYTWVAIEERATDKPVATVPQEAAKADQLVEAGKRITSGNTQNNTSRTGNSAGIRITRLTNAKPSVNRPGTLTVRPESVIERKLQKLNDAERKHTKPVVETGKSNSGELNSVSVVKGGNKLAHRFFKTEVLRVEIHRDKQPMPWSASPILLQHKIASENSDSIPAATKETKFSKHTRYFYITAMGAPDFTTVNYQRVSGTGSSWGLMAGYRINERLQIEAGAFLEKKHYYTDGVYFDKSKLPVYYQYVKMLYVDGNCSMVTIPLNIRYNLLAGSKHNWFITGGTSSYFMNREYYDYTYRHDNEPPKTRGYEYKNTEQNWMNVINVSLGFEKFFWRKYHLKVEPYFRVPVKGVGTGNLSLSSGGIYFGLGRRF